MITFYDRTNQYAAGVFYDRTTLFSAGPNISSISAAPNYLGSITITGTGFPTSQTGSAGVTIGGVSQTVTWNTSTSCSIASVARGTLPYGNVNIIVTDASGTTSTGFATTLSPQTGWTYTNLNASLAPGSERIESSADIVISDQAAIGNVQGGSSTDVTLFNDGSFSWNSGVTAFDVEVYDGTGYGSSATQTITVPQTIGGFSISVSSRPRRNMTSKQT